MHIKPLLTTYTIQRHCTQRDGRRYRSAPAKRRVIGFCPQGIVPNFSLPETDYSLQER